MWVYNEQAQDKKIEFEFLKDGKKCTSFPFGINFTGWRAAWVCYERDMDGVPEEGMNEIRIIAPDVEGKLLKDAMEVFYWIRSIKDIRKKPSTSELIDWVNALQIGGIPTDRLREELPFIGVVVKKDEDLETLKHRMD